MPGTPSHTPFPLSLGKDGDDRLMIDWNDGHRSVYTWSHLRQHCPCATCREERAKPADPFHILTDRELNAPKQLRPVELVPVGRYAYKIVWNDGHDTGLFTLESLRELCQCPACATKAKG